MRTLVIAEIGINHNGSLENAFKMIDAAADAGCSAVKFQLFTAKNLYPKSAGRMDWQDNGKKYTYDIYSAVQSFEMPLEWIDTLIDYCRGKGVEFLSSVFDEEGLQYLIKFGPTKIKLSSYSVTNLPLLEAAAMTNIPIILSTGGALLGEIEQAVNTICNYHCNLTLLHCSINYPTLLKDCNLGVLDLFRLAFPDLSYGYSDHTSEVSEAAVQAVYLGASTLEKHITIDKKMEGPDHFFALEPDELKILTRDVKKAEQVVLNDEYAIDPIIYGKSAKRVYEHESYLRDFAYTCLFSKRKIKKGEVISLHDIAILRPGKKPSGLAPKYLKLFKEHKVIAKHDLNVEDPINWTAII